MLRRLPVYLLLDCSESMAGQPLESLEKGVASMLMALRKNPYAMETVFLSVITFDAKARQLIPLSEIYTIAPPRLALRPGTALGAALTMLGDKLETEVIRTTADQKGDFRPLAFILTDGQPTDEWRAAAERLRNARPAIASIYGIGCGGEVDFATLGQIADVCIHMRDLSQDSFAKFFVWMSASVQSLSIEAGDRVNLDKIPLRDGLDLLDSTSSIRPAVTASLYFHVRCRNTRKTYLLRYAPSSGGETYTATEAHQLPDDFLSEGAMPRPGISSSCLRGFLACPYCGNPVWAKCGNCEQLFCDSLDSNEPVTCPNCETTLIESEEGTPFGVSGSAG